MRTTTRSTPRFPSRYPPFQSRRSSSSSASPCWVFCRGDVPTLLRLVVARQRCAAGERAVLLADDHTLGRARVELTVVGLTVRDAQSVSGAAPRLGAHLFIS